MLLLQCIRNIQNWSAEKNTCPWCSFLARGTTLLSVPRQIFNTSHIDKGNKTYVVTLSHQKGQHLSVSLLVYFFLLVTPDCNCLLQFQASAVKTLTLDWEAMLGMLYSREADLPHWGSTQPALCLGRLRNTTQVCASSLLPVHSLTSHFASFWHLSGPLIIKATDK